MSPFRLSLAVGLLLASSASSVVAQHPAPAPVPASDSLPLHGQVVSISPLFAMLGFFTGEFERRLSRNATLGVGGSAFELGPFGYRSLDAKVRFYPAERALEGFAVGLSAGAIWLSADEGGLFSADSHGSGVVVGTEATYTWLTGRRHNLAFSLGGGLKRIVRYGGYDVSGAQLTYPTVRASLGVAF
jgi:hypothetical protein